MTDNSIPRAVQEYVEAHTRTYATGEKYAVDERGCAMFHSHRDGCPNWSQGDLIAWTRSSKPELWGEPAKAVETKPAFDGPNPFATTTVNYTEQMILMKRDPALAARLEAEAKSQGAR